MMTHALTHCLCQGRKASGSAQCGRLVSAGPLWWRRERHHAKGCQRYHDTTVCLMGWEQQGALLEWGEQVATPPDSREGPRLLLQAVSVRHWPGLVSLWPPDEISTDTLSDVPSWTMPIHLQDGGGKGQFC
jgi:hypothetical protein